MRGVPADTAEENSADADLDRLQRWVDSGGYFAVLARRGGDITLALLTCSGGEEMGRIVSADPAVAAWCTANDDVRADGPELR